MPRLAEIRNLQTLLDEINHQPPLTPIWGACRRPENPRQQSSLGAGRSPLRNRAKVSAEYNEQEGEVTVLAEFEPPAPTEEGS
jgi:hypothetical protein